MGQMTEPLDLEAIEHKVDRARQFWTGGAAEALRIISVLLVEIHRLRTELESQAKQRTSG